MTTIEAERPGTVSRVLRHPMFRLLIALLFTVAAVAMSKGVSLLIGPHQGNLHALLISGSVAAIFVGAYALFCRFIEHRPVREFALRGAAPELVAGIVIGLVLSPRSSR